MLRMIVLIAVRLVVECCDAGCMTLYDDTHAFL